MSAGKQNSDFKVKAPFDPLLCRSIPYVITGGPLEEGPEFYGLTEAEFKQVAEITQELQNRPLAESLLRLETLIAAFPQVPKLWNHLAVAYQRAGRRSDAERLIKETYQRFPEYLFGIINFGMMRLDQGHPERVPTILRGTFALHRLQHGRMIYHVSEVRSFFGLLACYFLAVHDREKAARYLDMLEELDPDHPLTQMVRSRTLLSLSDILLCRG